MSAGAALTLTEDEVVELCDLSGHRMNFCVYPAINPIYFIKYGGGHIMGEARTQAYVYDRTIDVPGGPRVPKVYHAFERRCCSYIVMEYIDAPTAEELLAQYPSRKESVYNSIAAGISWLLHLPLPLPPDPCLGPIGGGFVVHRFFRPDHEAPLEFAHVLALQRYANQALRRGTPGGNPDVRIDIESEERCFYHSDIRLPNFLVNPDTEEITFVDFQHVGILTTSFASYGLRAGDPLFSPEMVARVDFPESAQLPAMYRAAACLMQCGGSKLGLDEQGFPRPRPIRKKAKDPPKAHENEPTEIILKSLGDAWS